MIEISVIMPVYNASRYLGEALQSILQQKYKEFELICINDASTDNTMDILYSYAHMDSRIKLLINEERMGAAYSRNKGIKEAVGDYVVFFDGDDIYDEELLELACQEIKRTDADIVLYEAMLVPTEQIYEKRFKVRSDKFIEKYCNNTFTPRECDPLVFSTWDASTQTKLYKRNFIISNQLEFQSLSCCNDVYFGYMALMLADKVIMLYDRRVMYYTRVHNEISRISYNRNPMCAYYAMEKLAYELEKRGLFKELFRHYYCLLFGVLVTALTKAKIKEESENFYTFLKNEGMEKLTLLYRQKNLYLDGYMVNLLSRFKELDFASEWYKYESPLSCHLGAKEREVIELIENYRDNGLKIALWGVGIYGKTFLGFLQNHHVRIEAVIDQDENKWGQGICGYRIMRPEEMIGEVQVIIASSDLVYGDLVKRLKGHDMEIINVFELVGQY